MSTSFIEDLKNALPKHVLTYIGDKHIQEPKREKRRAVFKKSMPVPSLHTAVPSRFHSRIEEYWSDRFTFHLEGKDYTILAGFEEEHIDKFVQPFEFVLYEGKVETNSDYGKPSVMFIKMTGENASISNAGSSNASSSSGKVQGYLNIEKAAKAMPADLRRKLIQAMITIMRRYFKTITPEDITLTYTSRRIALPEYMENIVGGGGAAKKLRYTVTGKEYIVRMDNSTQCKYIMIGSKRTYLRDIRGKFRYV